MDQKIDEKTAWHFVKTRLTEAEFKEFSFVLLTLGIRGSRFLRKVIRETIGEGPDLLKNDLQSFREATFQIGAIGRNLNQLVRAFHSGGMSAGQVNVELLEALKDQVTKHEEELVEAVTRSRQRWV